MSDTSYYGQYDPATGVPLPQDMQATPPTRIVVTPPQPEDANRLDPPAPEQADNQPGVLSRVFNRLVGGYGEEPRYQTWPERMIRSGLTAPGDAVSGDLPMVDPETGHTSEAAIQRAQDTAGLAMTGGLAGTGEGGMVVGSGPVRGPNMKFKKVTGPEASDPNYVYHATSAERAQDIASEGLNLHKPHEFTDQEIWPDGKVEPRNYFTQTAGNTWQFAPEEGSPALLRVRKDAHPFKRESTGDLYSTKPVPADKIEYLDETGKWTALNAKNDAAAPLSALEKRGPIWHSPVENALEQSTTGSAPGRQWLATLQNARGVKPEELEWTGLREFLISKGDEKVTRQELHEHLDQNRVQLKDVVKTGEEGDWDPASDGPGKYSSYQLPGGENYREHLLTLPEKGISSSQFEIRPAAPRPGWEPPEGMVGVYHKPTGEHISNFSDATKAQEFLRDPQRLRDLGGNWLDYQGKGANYNSSHWDEPNVLAHVRTNDRMMGDKKTLHIEEVQSDWHQAGRKSGYKTGERPATEQEIKQGVARTNEQGEPVVGGHGVPDAPFKTSWPELAMKRMVRRAAEEGYDRISWTPGEAQAARYDLSKHYDALQATKLPNGNFHIAGKLAGGSSSMKSFQTLATDVPVAKLADHVGKEMAEKMVGERPHSPREAQQKVDEYKQHLIDTYGPKWYDKKIPQSESDHYNALIKAEHTAHDPAEFSGLDLKVGGEGMREFYDKMLPKVAEKIGKAHGVKVQRGDLSSEEKYFVVNENGKRGASFNSRSKAEETAKIYPGAKVERETTPVHYFDIPQSLRDQALQKGMPLFSGGRMFVPATAPPEKDKK